MLYSSKSDWNYSPHLVAIRMAVLLGICAGWPCAAAANSDEQQIRTIRQQVDSAFEHHNAKELAAFYRFDGHFSAPAVHLDGADAIQRTNNSMFSRRPDVNLNHRISRIAVNEEWGIASEQGEWVDRLVPPLQ